MNIWKSLILDSVVDWPLSGRARDALLLSGTIRAAAIMGAWPSMRSLFRVYASAVQCSPDQDIGPYDPPPSRTPPILADLGKSGVTEAPRFHTRPCPRGAPLLLPAPQCASPRLHGDPDPDLLSRVGPRSRPQGPVLHALCRGKDTLDALALPALSAPRPFPMVCELLLA